MLGNDSNRTHCLPCDRVFLPPPRYSLHQEKREEERKGEEIRRTTEPTINCSPRYCEMSAEGVFILSNIREAHFKQPLISVTFVRYPWLSTDVIETSRVTTIKEIISNEEKKRKKERERFFFFFGWMEMDWNEMKMGEGKLTRNNWREIIRFN